MIVQRDWKSDPADRSPGVTVESKEQSQLRKQIESPCGRNSGTGSTSIPETLLHTTAKGYGS